MIEQGGTNTVERCPLSSGRAFDFPGRCLRVREGKPQSPARYRIDTTCAISHFEVAHFPAKRVGACERMIENELTRVCVRDGFGDQVCLSKASRCDHVTTAPVGR